MKIDVHTYDYRFGYIGTSQFELDFDLELNAVAIKLLGLRFTAEILKDNSVCLCIENPEYGDYDSEISPYIFINLIKTMQKMISRFDSLEYKEWLIQR